VIQAGPPAAVTYGEMLLRLSPADAMPLFGSERLRADFGGAEANVAVALSHLGVTCEYVTRLPDSLLGDAALDALRREGVGVRHVLRGPERLGLYFVEPSGDVAATRIVYDRRHSAFAAISAEMLAWPAILGGARWFHGTGITAALGPGPVGALAGGIAAARAASIPVSVDLNYRPALWRDREAAPIVGPLVCGVDLLIANPHSARAMLGLAVTDDALATADGARDLAARLVAGFRCARVALTRREVIDAATNRWSAYLYDAAHGTLLQSRTWTVGVVDRIGGGDAFAASLIAALLEGRDPADALEFAVAASALKLRVPGDFNRASTAEVDRLLGDLDARGARVAALVI
jgi:2-dehydro-3-deoxygluconokinase